MDTVLITGGTGLVGIPLQTKLRDKGFRVLVLTRSKDKVETDDQYVYWNVGQGIISDRVLEADYVINLAGAGVADGRWTKARRRNVISSRVDTTKMLIQTFLKGGKRLKGFLSASAIGYYGDGANRLLTEEDGVITDEFLSQVCVAWEDAADEAREISDRLVIYRISTVLSRQGGALSKMDMTIPFGVANYLGKGDQYFSWIHIDDLCDMFIEGLENQEMSGIYNACAPEEITNKDFTIELRDAINSKAIILPAPSLGIKLAFGEMSRVVLNSTRVSAQKILDLGFQFQYMKAEEALADLYKKR